MEKYIDISTPKYPGAFAIIDKEDYERVSKITWRISGGRGKVRCVQRGKTGALSLHRYILELDKNNTVIAKNGNFLDCRKENLVITKPGTKNINLEIDESRQCAILAQHQLDYKTTRVIDISTERYPETYAFVDVEDYYPLLGNGRWHVGVTRHGQYKFAARMAVKDSSRKVEKMHRVVLGVADLQLVEHINGNTFDNRKSNLRPCNHADNQKNIGTKKKKGTSKYKGVKYRPKTNNSRPWQASIMANRKAMHLGYFEVEEDAARAYDRAAIIHHGEFARTNVMLGLLPPTDKTT
ncbi:MAG: hypothetical protein HUJ30_02370 [Gammaproteobacteria bacterium]|nr:hypothetical protein [Gammaproteobacteria bacterium]